jgi:hypothetical protein
MTADENTFETLGSPVAINNMREPANGLGSPVTILSDGFFPMKGRDLALGPFRAGDSGIIRRNDLVWFQEDWIRAESPYSECHISGTCF